jgi:enoyl-CoA hydratase/carnithine racemase
MSEALVLVERRDRVGILTMNRPDARNAINSAITEAMADAIEAQEADDEIWLHVITGSGDKSFCAGADLKEVARGRRNTDDRPPRDLGGFAGITSRTFAKPVIAAVNGTALGGGTEICLACDLVVADEHAQFGLPEVRRGLFAGAMGLERLPRRIPPAIAMELILTGQPMDARRALELGLINRVVPRGSCVDAAVALAAIVCEGAPLAVRYSKAVARASFSMAEEEPSKALRDLRKTVFASEDFREGPRAFAEKRTPRWRGR